mgnify:CR=1 FL=1
MANTSTCPGTADVSRIEASRAAAQAEELLGREVNVQFATLRELAKTGMTIFLVEQNANHALRLSDRAYVMVNGEIRMSGTGKELLVNEDVRNAYLGGH